MRRLLSVREIRLVLAVHFFWHLSASSQWIIPKWLTGMSYSEGRIGLIMGTAGVAALVFTPLVAQMIDKYSRIRLLRMATLASVFLIASLPVAIRAGDFWIDTLRVCQGIAFGFAFPVAGALVADFAPPGERVRALGLFGIITQMTQAGGPGASEWIANHFGYDWLFLVAGLASGLGFLLTFVLSSSVRKRGISNEPVPDEIAPVQKPGIQKSLSGLVAGTGVTYGAMVTFVPVMLLKLGVASVGPFFAAVSLASVAVRTFFGGLGDRMNQDRLILFSGLGATCAVAFAALVGWVAPAAGIAGWLGILLGIAFGCAAGLFYPVANVRYIEMGPVSIRGKRMAYYAAIYNTGITAGNLVLGFAAQHLGFAAMYSAVAVMHLLTAMIFLQVSLANRARRQVTVSG